MGSRVGRHSYAAEIVSTGDDALYRMDRCCPSAAGKHVAYRVPLPAGFCRLTLRFAETRHRTPPPRLFDVDLEGRRVLTTHEPLAAGFAPAHSESFEVEVRDGALEIGFGRRSRQPHVACVEIERIPRKKSR